MKAYTDLEQSKELSEFLPIESADMYYQYVLPKSDKIKHNPEIGNPINALEWYNKGYSFGGKEPITLDEYCVPCWSLATLLDVLPKQIGRYTKSLYWFDEGWHCEYLDEDSEGKYGVSADNPLDACYELIIKLRENNLI